MRLLLIAALVLHVTAIVQLTRRNRAARPRGYPARRERGSLSARTMTTSGSVILVFVVLHILHFTTGTIHPTRYREGEVYANLHGAFGEWWIVAMYLVVIALLGLHLRHALWSASQTGGVDTPDRNPFLRHLANVVTALVVVGFAAVPIAIVAGALSDPVAG
jgi:succinate dehydrogenase / fumarate reductase cytochrome b subunit